MRKIADKAGIVGALDALAFQGVGNLRHQGYPRLTYSLIEDRLVEHRYDDGPKPLIACLGVPVEFDHRRTKRAVGSADHSLEK